MGRIVLKLAIVALAAACAKPLPTVNVTESFKREQADFINEPGIGSIYAHAVARQRDGTPRTCAGLEAALIPVTDYATWRMLTIYGSSTRGRTDVKPSFQFSSTDPGYLSMMRRVTCDAAGYAEFKNVSDGDYYVVVGIQWEVPNLGTQGTSFMGQVSVKDGQRVEVIL